MILTGAQEDWPAFRLVCSNTIDKGETRSVNNGRGGRQGFCLSPILLVTYSSVPIGLVQGIRYHGNCWRCWRLQNRRTGNSHCEICRWPRAIGRGGKGVTGPIDTLIKLECAMEWKWMWKTNKVMGLSRQQSTIRITIDQNNRKI